MKQTRKKHRGLRFLLSFVLFLTAISIAGFAYLNHRNLSAELTPVAWKYSNEPLRNPYRGWYHTYDYTIADNVIFDKASLTPILKKDNLSRLCLLRINLSAYGEGAISAYGLSQIADILSAWSDTDKDIILRFTYGPDALQPLAEPSDITTTYLHMEQLSPIIKEYQSHIAIMQGSFLGSYGHGMNSRLIEDNDVSELMQYLRSLLDPSTVTAACGTEQYHRILNDTDDQYMEHFSIYYDDLNTLLSPDTIKRFQITSKKHAIGGTIGADNNLTDTETALTLLQQLHISYLQTSDSSAVLNAWKNTTFRDDSIFSGVTLYDYVTAHMGYRYVVTSASMEFNTWKDEQATLLIGMRNEGFANATHPFDTTLFLRNDETEELITFPLNADNRTWQPGEDITLSVQADIRNYDKGNYTLYLIMIDSANGDVIQLGNDIPLTSNGYEIGTLTLR